jgi:hypothetical protein
VSTLLRRYGHAGHAGDDLALALHQRSGGNPFFLTQLIHLVEEDLQGAGNRSDILETITLPRGLRDAILSQVHELPDAVRRVLAAAAVAGRAERRTAVLFSPTSIIPTDTSSPTPYSAKHCIRNCRQQSKLASTFKLEKHSKACTPAIQKRFQES